MKNSFEKWNKCYCNKHFPPHVIAASSTTTWTSTCISLPTASCVWWSTQPSQRHCSQRLKLGLCCGGRMLFLLRHPSTTFFFFSLLFVLRCTQTPHAHCILLNESTAERFRNCYVDLLLCHMTHQKRSAKSVLFTGKLWFLLKFEHFGKTRFSGCGHIEAGAGKEEKCHQTEREARAGEREVQGSGVERKWLTDRISESVGETEG